MRKAQLSLAVLLTLAGSATPALAYVGPGAGLSLLGALWGLVVAVFAAIGFLIFWPLRRVIFRRKPAASGPGGEGEAHERAAAPKAPSS